MQGAEFVDKYIRIAGKDIALFKFILEGYDGMATITTVDPQAAYVKISIARHGVGDLDGIVAAMQEEFPFVGFQTLTAHGEG